MTSNIGAQYIDKMQTIGFSAATDDKMVYEEVKEKVMGALKDSFRPEFLNRLDEIILFDVLSNESIRKIVDIEIDKINKRLLEKDIHLSFTDAVYDLLAKEGYNPQYGARPLRRLIQNKVLTPLANMMIDEGLKANRKVLIGLDKNNNLTFENKSMKETVHKIVNKGVKKKVVRK